MDLLTNQLNENKMEDLTIQLSSGQRYSDIPELANATNCVVAKTVTGLGFTHCMCTNNKPTIIVIPLISIARSKKDMPNIFCNVAALHDDITSRREALRDYLVNSTTPKVFCTPELLMEVTYAIKASHFELNDFTLALDEVDMCQSHAAFRESMPELFDTFDVWSGDKIACSATFVDFSRRSIQLMPRITVVPAYEHRAKLSVMPTNSPEQAAQDISCSYRDGSRGKLVMFVNDSETIISIIDNLELTSEECKVFAGSSVSGKVDEVLGKGYVSVLAGNGMLETPITFMTKSMVAGNDIKESDISVLVMSNAFKGDYALFGTNELVQALGRFRNGYSRAVLVTNFNENPTNKFESKTNELDTANAALSALTAFEGNVFLRDMMESTTRNLIKNEGVCIRANKHEINLEMIDSKAQDANTVNNYISYHQLSTNGADKLQFEKKEYIEVSKFNKTWSVFKMFKELCVEDDKIVTTIEVVLERLRNAQYTSIQQLEDIISFCKENVNLIPDVLQCKTYKGFKIIKTNMYQETLSGDISKRVLESFSVGSQYTAAEVKGILQAVYGKAGFESKAKATDLNQWFEISSKTSRVEGKVSRVTIIEATK